MSVLRPSIHDVANGKWRGILAGIGLSELALSGKHTACPFCGGKDRFRFDDKGGRGTFYCSHCGAGTGVDLVMRIRGCDFKEAAREIESLAGVVPQIESGTERSEEKKLATLRRVWGEAKPLREGDEAMRYLAGRGLRISPPSCLRLHPGLIYWDGTAAVGTFPAIVALVNGLDGRAVTLHRTYLMDGRKAPVPSPKKLMPGKSIKGAAIRLFPAAPCLGIAEGIETALASSIQFQIPVWSCVSAAGIESFESPAGVRRVVIFADNDANFTGQRAAFSLANRLAMGGIEADVRVPEIVGDWLDVFNARRT